MKKVKVRQPRNFIAVSAKFRNSAGPMKGQSDDDFCEKEALEEAYECMDHAKKVRKEIVKKFNLE